MKIYGYIFLSILTLAGTISWIHIAEKSSFLGSLICYVLGIFTFLTCLFLINELLDELKK
jgi:hypothetical protein